MKDSTMQIRHLTITGMSCKHCILHVTEALKNISGVRVEHVDIGKAKIFIDSTKVTEETLRHALEHAGYQLTGIE